MLKRYFSVFALSLALLATVGVVTPPVWAASETQKTSKSSGKSTAKHAQATKKKAERSNKKRVAAKRKARKARLVQRSREREMNDYKVVNGLPVLRSAYALVLDQQTGEPIYAKNPDHPTSIASITKLMTAMVVLDASLPLDELITVNNDDVDRLKGTRSRVALGTSVSRSDLLHMALIASENRAAAALSRAYPGGRGAFVGAMNSKAESLGMRNSYFVDGTGLSSNNRSTAQDLARMVAAAYRYPVIREISTLGSYDIWVPGKRSLRQLAFNNTNALTRYKSWDIGISKTGYISEAGHCLVMQARISERPLIIVLLDSQGKYSRIGDANRLRRWLENGAMERFAASKPGRAV